MAPVYSGTWSTSSAGEPSPDIRPGGPPVDTPSDIEPEEPQ
jgi:hypothetical protein